LYTIEDLLKHGVALVPMPYGQKGPTKPAWNARHNVITKPGQAELVNGLNIGIAHAYCSPNATCAIDLDDFKEASQWFATHNIDITVLLYANDAVVIHSGKKNSLKILYKLPLGISLPSKQIKAETGMVVEFRCASANGLTVQDVLPPSLHPSGTQYQYLGAGSILSMPLLPDDLLQLWLTLLAPCAKSNKKIVGYLQETPKNIAVVKSKLAHISADCEYFTYRDVVWSMLSTGWTCSEALAREWCETSTDKFNETSFNSLLNSYKVDLPNPITLGTLHFLAKNGGWNG